MTRRLTVSLVFCVVSLVAVLAGCNLLQYQFCINNLTSFDLKEVNVTAQGAASWGTNDLSGELAPGGSEDIKGFAAGVYMVRGVFDVIEGENFCYEVYNNEVIVVNEGIEITTTNVCIDYAEGLEFDEKLAPTCLDIYGTVRFVI